MIKYNLSCKCGKVFESWFSSSVEYDSLYKKKLIRCIYCNSSHIQKSVMAPNIVSKSNKVSHKNQLDKNLKKQLIHFRQYIEKNCKNVGENFIKEARKIYYDKKTSKGIYGKATAEETSELLEEGIEFETIPWIDNSEN